MYYKFDKKFDVIYACIFDYKNRISLTSLKVSRFNMNKKARKET